METEQLLKKLTKEAKPVKAMRSPLRRSIIWFIVSIIYVAGLVYYMEPRFDLANKITEPLFILEMLIAAIGAILAGVAASYLAFPDSYQNNWIKWVALLPFAALAGILGYQYYFPNIAEGEFVNATTFTYQCMMDITIFSIFPIIITIYAIRKAATTRQYWCGSMTTLSAVNFSYIALRLIEPNDVMQHLIFWHYAPMLQLVFVGMLLGKLLLKW